MNRGKVVIIGAGSVGTSIAYSMINQSLCQEIVIIDINKAKAEGEAFDGPRGSSFRSRDIGQRAGQMLSVQEDAVREAPRDRGQRGEMSH